MKTQISPDFVVILVVYQINRPFYIVSVMMAELAARSLSNLRFRLIAKAWVQIPAVSKSDLTKKDT